MRIVDIETDDIATFKTIVEILHGFISEANAEFIKDYDKYEKLQNGNEDSDSDNDSDDDSDNEDKEIVTNENKGAIKILTMDDHQVMITMIKLNGNAFRKFDVKIDSYKVGLNLDELCKYIKNVDRDGIMNIFIDTDDSQKIVFKVASNNAPRESICELRVLNLPEKKKKKLEADVFMGVRIPCQEFHKACKDLLQFDDIVEITCDPNKFVITCTAECSDHSRIFKADGSENGVAIKVIDSEEDNADVPKIIRLVFNMRYINTMYKCSQLCDNMEIFLNKDSPMYLRYSIKLMGEMLVGISPKNMNVNADDYNEDDDDFYDTDDDIDFLDNDSEDFNKKKIIDSDSDSDSD
jgi:proliferating cell nuclear antigen PCNA